MEQTDKIKTRNNAAHSLRHSGKPLSEPISVDAVSFDDFVKKHPFAVVDCWSPTCPPCRMLAPVLDALASKHAGKVVFGKVSFAEPDNVQIARKFGVEVIPTLLVFKKGKLVDRMVGYKSEDELEQALGL